MAPETSAPPTTDAPAATPEDTSKADAVTARAVFDKYNQALVARDFTAVCAVTDPTVATQLIAAMISQGQAVSDCAAAVGAVYLDATTAAALDEASRSLTIDDVTVDGDVATVAYFGGVNGNTVSGLKSKLKRTDDAWLILPTDA